MLFTNVLLCRLRSLAQSANPIVSMHRFPLSFELSKDTRMHLLSVESTGWLKIKCLAGKNAISRQPIEIF